MKFDANLFANSFKVNAKDLVAGFLPNQMLEDSDTFESVISADFSKNGFNNIDFGKVGKLTVDEALAINGGIGTSPRAHYDGGGGGSSAPNPTPVPSSNSSSFTVPSTSFTVPSTSFTVPSTSFTVPSTSFEVKP